MILPRKRRRRRHSDRKLGDQALDHPRQLARGQLAHGHAHQLAALEQQEGRLTGTDPGAQATAALTRAGVLDGEPVSVLAAQRLDLGSLRAEVAAGTAMEQGQPRFPARAAGCGACGATEPRWPWPPSMHRRGGHTLAPVDDDARGQEAHRTVAAVAGGECLRQGARVVVAKQRRAEALVELRQHPRAARAQPAAGQEGARGRFGFAKRDGGEHTQGFGKLEVDWHRVIRRRSQ